MSRMLIPKTVAEACEMLETDGRIACAGATNLYVDRQKGKYLDMDMVSLHELGELCFIRHGDDGWHVGALTVFDTIEDTFRDCGPMAALAQAASEVGSPQIRNRGTIGGNILSASPAADTVPVMMALDARLILKSKDGERTVPINGFMKGPGKTDIHRGELLTEIIFPEKRGKALFRKVGKRNALAISVINMAVHMEWAEGKVKEAAIAIGSAGPTALRAPYAEALLAGRTRPESEEQWQALREELGDALDRSISPIDDIRATASYRRLLARNLVFQMVRQLWDEQGEDSGCACI